MPGTSEKKTNEVRAACAKNIGNEEFLLKILFFFYLASVCKYLKVSSKVQIVCFEII